MKLQELINKLQQQLDADPSLGEFDLAYAYDQEEDGVTKLEDAKVYKGQLYKKKYFKFVHDYPGLTPTHLFIELYNTANETTTTN